MVQMAKALSIAREAGEGWFEGKGKKRGEVGGREEDGISKLQSGEGQRGWGATRMDWLWSEDRPSVERKTQQQSWSFFSLEPTSFFTRAKNSLSLSLSYYSQPQACRAVQDIICGMTSVPACSASLQWRWQCKEWQWWLQWWKPRNDEVKTGTGLDECRAILFWPGAELVHRRLITSQDPDAPVSLELASGTFLPRSLSSSAAASLVTDALSATHSWPKC